MTTIATWVAAHEVAFGAVKIKVQSNGGWADWVAPAFVATRHVPGSAVSIAQNIGLGPERVDYQIALGSTTDFAALKALVGTRATLTVLDGTATTTGATSVIGGRTYLLIPDVLLVEIDPGSVSRRVAGHILCKATFQR